MARDKERSVNPAQQQRKLEKAKQLKKSRAEVQAKRNEKLAHRNPARIQRQIDDLKALEASGEIKAREKAILADLERDLKAIHKAREALGDKAPRFGPEQRRREGDGRDNVLGKRRHDGERKHFQHRRDSSGGSDTDDSVRRVPMPEDTPPPVPREFRRHFRQDGGGHQQGGDGSTTTAAAAAPAPVARVTYESAPQVRDLQKDATSRFVPDVVRRKQDAAKGGAAGRLIEPEEMDRLEAEGYLNALAKRQGKEEEGEDRAQDQEDQGMADAKRLAEEEQRFLRELEMQDDIQSNEDEGIAQERHSTRNSLGPPQRPSHHVEMEEIEDEDA